MRPQGRLRAGFFACPPEAIADALRFLPDPGCETHVLDPCAGDGRAVRQLASGLGIPEERVWCVELDAGRGDEIREWMPAANVLAPASFHHTKISREAFGLVYSNPPFDDSMDGGRVELRFFASIPPLLVPGGVCLFVCPEAVAQRYDFRKAWAMYFEDVSCWPFPAGHRKFNEVFILGRKRADRDMDPYVTHFRQRIPKADMVVPISPGPRVFERTALTEPELVAALEASPLLRFLRPLDALRIARPPLALSVGHLALLLSSGQLDGLVCPPGGPRHVVRGTARKHEELTEETTEEDKNGVKTTKVYTERIRLLVRAVDETGVIHTLE